MTDGVAIVIAVIGFVVGFPLMWVGVLTLASRLGGWSRLALRFPAHESPAGETFNWCSVKLGWLGRYNNCIDIEVSTQGVRLQPMAPFRFGHPAVFLPWRVIAGMAPGTQLFRRGTQLSVSVESGRSVAMTVFGQEVADSLARHAPATVAQPE